jgi:hypothetical protein
VPEDLRIARSSEAEDVTIVVYYLECSKAVLGVFQVLVHRNGSADVLFIQRVGVGGVDVGVPARPFVARMIRLRVNLRDNRLQTDHDTVPADKGPEILADPVASSLIGNFEAELGLVEVEARLKILGNKARSDTVEGGHG